MRNGILAAALAVLLIAFSGCGKPADQAGHQQPEVSDGPPSIEGYVTGREDGRMLVVDPIPQDFSASGGMKEFYNAIWFSNVPENMNIGEKVQVWFDVVEASYPGQAAAKRVRAVQAEAPDRADLTEAEAIRRALAADQADTTQVAVIRSATYDEAADAWSIQLKRGDRESSLRIDDTAAEASAPEPTESAADLPEVAVEQLRNEFEARLYQEVDEDTGKVIRFSTKAEWIEHMAEVADIHLAEAYADDFYEEKDGALYLISRGGPALLTPDQPYELKSTGERQAQAIQKGNDLMYGKYELTITYEYRDGRWIILNRDFESLE